MVDQAIPRNRDTVIPKKMTLSERKKVLIQLGEHLRREDDEYLQAVMHRTQYNNAWFTIENQQLAVRAIAQVLLDPEKLEKWLGAYTIPEQTEPKTIGLIMAGNIPLVGFHDLLCVFAAGHRAMIKLSDKDQYLLPYLLKLMSRFDARTEDYFQIVETMKGFDAVIATGSNNSARYFEAYFGQYPHIIRRNRNAVAVLDGRESEEELRRLGKDVFQYFGLGCRNVAKVYVPRNYDFNPLLEILHEHRDLALHSKYKNNFDYNYALFVLNKVEYKANGCIILTENPAIQSHIAGLHYEYYDDLKTVSKEISEREAEIQCVIAREGLLPFRTYAFGQAQAPELWDYADGVDTMAFLLKLAENKTSKASR